MLKRMIFTTTMVIGIILSTQQNCSAQEQTQEQTEEATKALTKEELKAEREALKSELKSQEVLDRKAKFETLEAPKKPCGVRSVDDLASTSTILLDATKENNKLIPELYKRTIGETVDGVTDVTVKQPTLEELTALALNLVTQIKTVAGTATALSSAPSDISKLSPLKAPKATKSLNYSKNVLGLLAPELQLNLKVVNHLIATLNSSKNL